MAIEGPNCASSAAPGASRRCPCRRAAAPASARACAGPLAGLCPVLKLVGRQLDTLTAIELGQSGADIRLVFSRGPDELRIRSRARSHRPNVSTLRGGNPDRRPSPGRPDHGNRKGSNSASTAPPGMSRRCPRRPAGAPAYARACAPSPRGPAAPPPGSRVRARPPWVLSFAPRDPSKTPTKPVEVRGVSCLSCGPETHDPPSFPDAPCAPVPRVRVPSTPLCLKARSAQTIVRGSSLSSAQGGVVAQDQGPDDLDVQWTARELRRTPERIATPCSVNAQGGKRSAVGGT
jgi:hypothetical protein